MELDFEKVVSNKLELKFALIDVEPRYFEDATVNGETDSDELKNVRMPLVDKEKGTIEFIVDLETGQIQDWTKGITANIYYKICDAGFYFLLDENMNKVAERKNSYVPIEFLTYDNDNDYLSWKINENGVIEGWNFKKLFPIYMNKWTIL